MSEYLCATNQSKGAILARRVRVATSFQDRCVGLLGTTTLPVDQGLYLTPCRSVHTFFMRYAIDVIFLDAQHRILSARTLAPWRFSSWERRAAGVLELTAGTLARTQTKAGDHVELKAI
jgi:uncharacterized membrane protein (UPF0127 family)